MTLVVIVILCLLQCARDGVARHDNKEAPPFHQLGMEFGNIVHRIFWQGSSIEKEPSALSSENSAEESTTPYPSHSGRNRMSHFEPEKTPTSELRQKITNKLAIIAPISQNASQNEDEYGDEYESEEVTAEPQKVVTVKPESDEYEDYSSPSEDAVDAVPPGIPGPGPNNNDEQLSKLHQKSKEGLYEQGKAPGSKNYSDHHSNFEGLTTTEGPGGHLDVGASHIAGADVHMDSMNVSAHHSPGSRYNISLSQYMGGGNYKPTKYFSRSLGGGGGGGWASGGGGGGGGELGGEGGQNSVPEEDYEDTTETPESENDQESENGEDGGSNGSSDDGQSTGNGANPVSDSGVNPATTVAPETTTQTIPKPITTTKAPPTTKKPTKTAKTTRKPVFKKSKDKKPVTKWPKNKKPPKNTTPKPKPSKGPPPGNSQPGAITEIVSFITNLGQGNATGLGTQFIPQIDSVVAPPNPENSDSQGKPPPQNSGIVNSLLPTTRKGSGSGNPQLPNVIPGSPASAIGKVPLIASKPDSPTDNSGKSSNDKNSGTTPKPTPLDPLKTLSSVSRSVSAVTPKPGSPGPANISKDGVALNITADLTNPNNTLNYYAGNALSAVTPNNVASAPSNQLSMISPKSLNAASSKAMNALSPNALKSASQTALNAVSPNALKVPGTNTRNGGSNQNLTGVSLSALNMLAPNGIGGSFGPGKIPTGGIFSPGGNNTGFNSTAAGLSKHHHHSLSFNRASRPGGRFAGGNRGKPGYRGFTKPTRNNDPVLDDYPMDEDYTIQESSEIDSPKVSETTTENPGTTTNAPPASTEVASAQSEEDLNEIVTTVDPLSKSSTDLSPETSEALMKTEQEMRSSQVPPTSTTTTTTPHPPTTTETTPKPSPPPTPKTDKPHSTSGTRSTTPKPKTTTPTKDPNTVENITALNQESTQKPSNATPKVDYQTMLLMHEFSSLPNDLKPTVIETNPDGWSLVVDSLDSKTSGNDTKSSSPDGTLSQGGATTDSKSSPNSHDSSSPSSNAASSSQSDEEKLASQSTNSSSANSKASSAKLSSLSSSRNQTVVSSTPAPTTTTSKRPVTTTTRTTPSPTTTARPTPKPKPSKSHPGDSSILARSPDPPQPVQLSPSLTSPFGFGPQTNSFQPPIPFFGPAGFTRSQSAGSNNPFPGNPGPSSNPDHSNSGHGHKQGHHPHNSDDHSRGSGHHHGDSTHDGNAPSEAHSNSQTPQEPEGFSNSPTAQAQDSLQSAQQQKAKHQTNVNHLSRALFQSGGPTWWNNNDDNSASKEENSEVTTPPGVTTTVKPEEAEPSSSSSQNSQTDSTTSSTQSPPTKNPRKTTPSPKKTTKPTHKHSATHTKHTKHHKVGKPPHKETPVLFQTFQMFPSGPDPKSKSFSNRKSPQPGNNEGSPKNGLSSWNTKTTSSPWKSNNNWVFGPPNSQFGSFGPPPSPPSPMNGSQGGGSQKEPKSLLSTTRSGGGGSSSPFGGKTSTNAIETDNPKKDSGGPDQKDKVLYGKKGSSKSKGYKQSSSQSSDATASNTFFGEIPIGPNAKGPAGEASRLGAKGLGSFQAQHSTRSTVHQSQKFSEVHEINDLKQWRKQPVMNPNWPKM